MMSSSRQSARLLRKPCGLKKTDALIDRPAATRRSSINGKRPKWWPTQLEYSSSQHVTSIETMKMTTLFGMFQNLKKKTENVIDTQNHWIACRPKAVRCYATHVANSFVLFYFVWKSLCFPYSFWGGDRGSDGNKRMPGSADQNRRR